MYSSKVLILCFHICNILLHLDNMKMIIELQSWRDFGIYFPLIPQFIKYKMSLIEKYTFVFWTTKGKCMPT